MYVSQATDKYTGLLGYGWTHNHDIRLIFPTDPGGQAGLVFFKDHSGNMYRFYQNTDGTYTAYTGLNATLK